MEDMFRVDITKEGLDNVLYALTRGSKFKQISDKDYISGWTDGDWSDYYYVFTNDNGLRIEFVDGADGKLWVTVFRPSLDCVWSWSGIMKFTTERMSYIQLRKFLGRYDMLFDDKMVYAKRELFNKF